MDNLLINRRRVSVGLGAVLASALLVRPGLADTVLDASEFGLVAGSQADQTVALQAALDAAVQQGKSLALPAGEFHVREVRLPGAMRISGVPGASYLIGSGDAPIARVGAVSNLMLEGIAFVGNLGGGEETGLLVLDGSYGISIRNCHFKGQATGIAAFGAMATIEACLFAEMGDAAIHSLDSNGLQIRGNRISVCGNAGVRIWRSASGLDGSIVTGNQISSIDWVGGGNGQNGNGVNVFQADGVIVSDNVFADCSFTAVRVNAGRNTQVRGNTCLNSGEVAIFSEFGFSGSIIADNIIDGAATGIDITNLDSGGYLASCTGNIVRNIFPRSAVNPDTRPVGIYAEADTVVANNVVENVPGVGIAAGYGPFVRNVLVTDNVLTGTDIGIGVTVVNDPQRGAVRVSGNLIAAPRHHPIAGMEWESVVSTDLSRDAGNYPGVTVTDNTVS